MSMSALLHYDSLEQQAYPRFLLRVYAGGTYSLHPAVIVLKSMKTKGKKTCSDTEHT